MDDHWRTLLAAFDAECRVLVDMLSTVDERGFAQTTNCPPWNLHELVVHICFSACTLRPSGPEPDPTLPLATSADYYRRFERDTDRYRTDNVERTQRVARRYRSGHDAVPALAAAWSDSRGRLEMLAPSLRIPGPANIERNGELLSDTAITLSDYFLTRLIALAAHAVDVAITLNVAPWTTSAAASAVTPTLLELLGGDCSRAELGWDDRTFLVVATGRRPLTAEERRRLGPRSELFPLLS